MSSLRVRLLLLVLLSAGPALALALYSAMEQRREAREQALAGARSVGTLFAQDQERTVDEARLLLGGLARLPAVTSQSSAACETIFMAIREGYPRYMNLGAMRPDGTFFCSARRVNRSRGPNPGLAAAFRESLETGGFAVSGFSIGQVSGRPLMMLTHAATDDAGRVSAVVFASLSLDWMNRIAAQAQLPFGATLTVMDTAGVVLARYPDGGDLIGQKIGQSNLFRNVRAAPHRSFADAGLDGVERLYTAVPVVSSSGSVHAHVLTGVPTAVAYAAANNALQRNLSWLLAITLLALIIAWQGGDRFIIRPVAGLLNATRQLKRGVRDARSGVREGSGELDQLAIAFDEMADALQQRQEELERSATTLRQQALVFESIVEGVLVMDTDGLVIDSNPAAERLFGYSREEMLGRSAALLHHPDVAVTLEAEIVDGMEREGRWSGEIRFIRKDGRAGVSEAMVAAQYDDQGRRVASIAVHRDVTDRKRAEEALRLSEERLRQSQKMEAVGRLAGGIAHDFNNLLTTIKGNVELALLDLPSGSLLRDDLDQVRAAAESAAILTRQLLSFSHSHSGEPPVLDLNSAVETATQILGRVVGSEIEIETDLAPDLWPVRAESAQIEQIVLNLGINARDAMPEAGRIGIHSYNLTLPDAPDAPTYPEPPGDYAVLSVSDTGAGMDELTRQRIFEPFFTSKERGKGTGLGLFTVYAIVEQTGGYVRVEPGRENGSTFNVLLPRATPETVGVHEPFGVQESTPHPGAQTILLVEDDPAVRMLALKLLDRASYHVLEAADGEEAVSVSRSYAGGIDLLLTDVIMPRMNGVELAQEVARDRPDIRVVFMSGFTDNVELPAGVGSGTLLRKPFSLDALMQVVRTALGSPASDPADGEPDSVAI